MGIGRLATVPNCIRFVRRTDRDQLLIYADGACINNGQANPKAGWAFVYKPGVDNHPISVGARLESKGPFGDAAQQTSNRAELRAVLAALRFRVWSGEGFTKLVLATDSEYAAEGATSWARGWMRNGWKTRVGVEVKNRDLWEALLGEIEKLDGAGVEVQFWRIPRAMNRAADCAAKEAAQQAEVLSFQDVTGVAT
ncbi:Ribonuclease H [Purpureocillium takamizusanense]|uniref:ribonuclease H n=1 Tax=Purpureocillium takamizusanense TaxID=2060973 RepID=A0A9Q8QPK8_9HYPO|nr:Ribonuclease H [Purpureocillium takamizusanense]UNI23037.1 Ribonuclease H [Purpureocillium takamizusanense]